MKQIALAAFDAATAGDHDAILDCYKGDIDALHTKQTRNRSGALAFFAVLAGRPPLFRVAL